MRTQGWETVLQSSQLKMKRFVFCSLVLVEGKGNWYLWALGRGAFSWTISSDPQLNSVAALVLFW